MMDAKKTVDERIKVKQEAEAEVETHAGKGRGRMKSVTQEELKTEETIRVIKLEVKELEATI